MLLFIFSIDEKTNQTRLVSRAGKSRLTEASLNFLLSTLHALNSSPGLKQNRLLRYVHRKFNENLLIGRWRLNRPSP
ncbi:MAG: hypothetical protein CMF36_11695 [Leeuwenhoekiella sp.]|nr:hypothetical protein [Leeuwenhoekiella sp.]MBA81783.1 hypothetical protein [Leeuwenhoekiella sp.]